MREKLIEFICSVEYGNGSLMGKNFQRGFIEKIADHLIENGVTIQKWISVKDSLPETAERVLVCRTWLGMVYKPVYGYYQDFPNQKGCWYILTEEGYYPQREVTHWMPMPEPPKGE